MGAFLHNTYIKRTLCVHMNVCFLCVCVKNEYMNDALI